MRRVFFGTTSSALFITFALALVPAVRAQQPPLQQRLEALLMDRHHRAERSDWLSLGGQAADLMMQLYSVETTPLAWRAKIIDGLRYFPTVPVIGFVKEIATQSHASATAKHPPAVLRREAIGVWAELQGPAALADLSDLLQHKDWRLRRAALRAMLVFNSVEADTQVRRHLDSEARPSLKRWAADALRRQQLHPKLKPDAPVR